jgi:uncharacterized protein (DUF1684 family)
MFNKSAMRNKQFAILIVTLLSGIILQAQTPRQEAEAWRAKHEADYRRDWASIAGLFELNPGRNTAGSAASNDIVLSKSLPDTIGAFVLTGDRVRFEPAANSGVTLRGKPVAAPVDLRDDAADESDELQHGDIRLVIHVTGEKRTLRVRDPNGALARGFKGFDWFPIDERYRVTGRFIRDDKPQQMQVVNTMGDIDTYPSEGVIEFTLEGQTLRLRPFTTRPNRFYIVFRDASAGQETYATARFLYADLKDDGTTVLDVNEAYNPPCSFNPYTTCPIPLKENRLPVKILAGEKKYAGPEPSAPAR